MISGLIQEYNVDKNKNYYYITDNKNQIVSLYTENFTSIIIVSPIFKLNFIKDLKCTDSYKYKTVVPLEFITEGENLIASD